MSDQVPDRDASGGDRSPSPADAQGHNLAHADGRATPQFPGCLVLELVRSGPIADVYRALQQPLGRVVLIKALSPSILPSSPFAASLEHEARLLAQLEHRNILKLYDFARTTDSMWLVLEHVEGVAVDELLSAHAQLRPVGAARRPYGVSEQPDEHAPGIDPLAAAAIALEITHALAHAHAQGIVHRNLRPAHVLLTRPGGIRLIEFAAASDERIPTAPELMDGEVAAPSYFSPEQILGEPPDPRSDLFALGVMLYEMVAGVRPFDGPDARSTTQRIRHDAPQPLSRLAPLVPSQLERVVQRLLEKMPSDRFGSAEEVATALELVLEEADRPTSHYIRKVIFEAGLLGLTVADAEAEPAPPPPQASLKTALGGLLLLSIVVLLAGTVIRLASAYDGAGLAEPGTHNLELRPANAGYLRVVADPWAHVVVDGERVETTPFAEPIPLTPGVHYVRLEHPAAPTEHRTITLAAGESVLLDVKLDVPRKAVTAPARPADAGADAAAPSP